MLFPATSNPSVLCPAGRPADLELVASPAAIRQRSVRLRNLTISNIQLSTVTADTVSAFPFPLIATARVGEFSDRGCYDSSQGEKEMKRDPNSLTTTFSNVPLLSMTIIGAGCVTETR